MITFTKVALPYGWLGNMSPHPVPDQHLLYWKTAEALFQALRFKHGSEPWVKIHDADSPMTAKMIAKSYKDEMVVEPRSPEDVQNMYIVLSRKVMAHADLRKALIATGSELLVEDVSKRRTSESNLFWGMALHPDTGHWFGQNVLGYTWARVRAELMAAKSTP